MLTGAWRLGSKIWWPPWPNLLEHVTRNTIIDIVMEGHRYTSVKVDVKVWWVKMVVYWVNPQDGEREGERIGTAGGVIKNSF